MPNPENVKPHEWKKGQSGNPSGRPKRKPLTGILPELLEGNLLPVATIVKGKKGEPSRIIIEYVELPDGLTYGDFLMVRTAQAAAIKYDATARRDVKEWAEGKTPEASKESDDVPEDDDELWGTIEEIQRRRHAHKQRKDDPS